MSDNKNIYEKWTKTIQETEEEEEKSKAIVIRTTHSPQEKTPRTNNATAQYWCNAPTLKKNVRT